MNIGAKSGLHILPQYTYHDDAEIAGTAEALTALHDAISYALKHGKAEINTFCSDGEGYTLRLRRLDHAEFDNEKPYYAFMNERPNTEEQMAAAGCQTCVQS